VFVVFGVGKFTNHASELASFHQYGLPAPDAFVYVIGVVELVGGVLLILGVALGFTNYLIDAQLPARAVEWVTGAMHSRYAFLLALNVCLLVVGCVMDMYSAIVVVVPIIVPLGVAYGIDPIHLGIIFLANMELGLLTPTAGINIFLSSYRFGKPVLQVSRAVIPMQLLLVVGLLLITYLPPLTTFLPRWVGR